MEVSNAVVLKSIPSCYYSSKSFSGGCHRQRVGFPGLRTRVMARPERWNVGFEDKGHLDYYMVCGKVKNGKGNKKRWNMVSSKKRMKLLKGLVKDLGAFSELGFGLEVDCDDNLVCEDDEKSKMISQAAETLLSQLKLLKTTEEEIKKQEKQKSKTKDSESSSSSSESSESSDSECDAVVNMKYLRKQTVFQPAETKESSLLTEQSLLSNTTSTAAMTTQLSSDLTQKCSNMILESTLNENATIEALNMGPMSLKQPGTSSSIGGSVVRPPLGRRIEVCMGGKCKKSGGLELMEEFKRVVGEEGVVVGCKCMGKCKSGPNVRVLEGNQDLVGVDDSLRTPSNALCIGVNLGDVELIVANCFGQDNKELGLAVASLHS